MTTLTKVANRIRNKVSNESVNKKIIRIAIAGNPNAGKTSIFNALTGQTQHVGNYPGVTVEQKIGRIEHDENILEFVDLPGTYSLSAFSIEEIVARDYVLKEKPDVIIDVLDSTNLERNLYLCLQFQELGVPVVGVLNMTDEAEKAGIHIDENQLSKILGLPFIKTIGSRGKGIDQLIEIAVQVAKGQIQSTMRHLNYGVELEQQHNIIINILKSDPDFEHKYPLHWIAIKLIENDPDAIKKISREHQHPENVLQAAESSRDWIQKHFGEDSETVVGEQRYAYIHGACREVTAIDPKHNRIDYTEMIDRVVLNKYLGMVVFIAIMFLIYHITFGLGNPISEIIDSFFAWCQQLINTYVPGGVLKDFITEGIIGGVGGVLIFFPIVLFLFLGLSFLEDTGYMARAAFVMDKFMHIFGLHGRSFIPMMVSTGCAVPGIMSARTLVNPKDRVLTILITPLMMCGAKTPVIAMLATAFFHKKAGLVFWSIWLSGWILALVLARIFRSTIYKGEASPFVMELPPYRMPTARGIATHMWEKSWAYVKKAGTFILAASIIIWIMLYFPRSSEHTKQIQSQQRLLRIEYENKINEITQPDVRDQLTREFKQKQHQLSALATQYQMSHSIGGRIGKFIAPVFHPCGFDWRIDIALFAGFSAKEVIISTMGIVYGIGETGINEETEIVAITPLKQKLKKDPHYNPRSMLALMVFVLIYIPCMATLATVKKELGRWKYPLFIAGYTFVVAWILATLVNQTGVLFGIGG